MVDVWKRVGSKPIADCRVFSVREDECINKTNGAKANFYVIENPDWVNIIVLTRNRQVLLIEQFRHGTECVTLEIPGGMVDEGESPADSARRELSEETGYSAKEFVFLGRSTPNPALQSNWIYHFAALDCSQTDVQNLDEHESIETRLVDLDEIPGLIDSEAITHSLVIAGFQRLENYFQKTDTAL